MDWLGIIAAILIFGISAFFEKDRKKGRSRHMPKPQADVPDSVPDSENRTYADVFTTTVSQAGPVSVSPYIAEAVASVEEKEPAAETSGTQVHEEAVHGRRKRRISGREMILNSELLKPKYLER